MWTVAGQFFEGIGIGLAVLGALVTWPFAWLHASCLRHLGY